MHWIGGLLLLAVTGLTGCAGEGPSPPAVTSKTTGLPPADHPSFTTLEQPTSDEPYLTRLAAYDDPKRSAVEQKAFPPTPPGAQLAHYESNGTTLPGWLFEPQGCQSCTGVLYLHNDYSLTRLSAENARPLVEAGFVVFIPSFRSENGNSGEFSLLLGGTEDAKAAADWLSQRPSVDPSKTFAIGHSLGGGMAALLALHEDVPLVLTASVGGIYRARTFSSWAKREGTSELVHFDPLDQQAVSLRLLSPNLRDMRRPVIAYAGRENFFDRRNAKHIEELARQTGAPVTAKEVAGGHMGSITEAVDDFINVVSSHANDESEKGAATPPATK